MTALLFGIGFFQLHEVTLEEADAEEQGGHAFHVMDAYVQSFESEGEKGSRTLAILRLLGLFDRPADPGALRILRTMSDDDWAAALETLPMFG